MSLESPENGEKPVPEKLDGQDDVSELALLGADEWRQKHRLERVMSALDRIEDADFVAIEEMVKGEIKPEGREIVLLQAVKGAIRESYNLLLSYHREQDGADGYWRTAEPIATIEAIGDGEPIKFYGLADVLEAQNYYHFSWTETLDRRKKLPERVERTGMKAVPEEVSMKAYLLLKDFQSTQRDLGLSYEDEDDPLEL